MLLRHGALILSIAVGALLVRAITTYLFCGLHDRFIHPIPMGWRHALIWGGLRGGVPIALVLNLPAELPGRDIVVAAVYGLVLSRSSFRAYRCLS